MQEWFLNFSCASGLFVLNSRQVGETVFVAIAATENSELLIAFSATKI